MNGQPALNATRTNLFIENARLRDMIGELRRGIGMIHGGLATPGTSPANLSERWPHGGSDTLINASKPWPGPPPETALSEVERDSFGRPINPATPHGAVQVAARDADRLFGQTRG